MRITYATTPAHEAELRAHVEDYDAYPPVRSLLIDYEPVARHPDRLALAAYLAFGRFASGRLEVPGWVSPALAAAIRTDSWGLVEDVGPVEYHPKGLPEGVTAARLSTALPPRAGDEAVIAVLPSDRWNGCLRSQRSLLVGANSHMLAGDPAGVRAHLAVAVLVAEDMAVDSIAVSASQAGEDQLGALAALLQPARLGLEVVDGPVEG